MTLQTTTAASCGCSDASGARGAAARGATQTDPTAVRLSFAPQVLESSGSDHKRMGTIRLLRSARRFRSGRRCGYLCSPAKGGPGRSMAKYQPKLNLDELVAIDVHTHAEISTRQPRDPCS